MARLMDLCEALRLHTDRPPATVRRLGGKLQATGLLPAAAARVGPDDAARLLIAVLAARSPLEAPEVVRAYAGLPAIALRHDPVDAGALATVCPTEDIVMQRGTEAAMAPVLRSFGSALAALIDLHSDPGPVAPDAVPTTITACRGLATPTATIRFPPSQLGVPARALVFAASPPPDAVVAVWAGRRSAVWASAPGRVLAALGQALATPSSTSRHPVARAPAGPAVQSHDA